MEVYGVLGMEYVETLETWCAFVVLTEVQSERSVKEPIRLGGVSRAELENLVGQAEKENVPLNLD